MRRPPLRTTLQKRSEWLRRPQSLRPVPYSFAASLWPLYSYSLPKPSVVFGCSNGKSKIELYSTNYPKSQENTDNTSDTSGSEDTSHTRSTSGTCDPSDIACSDTSDTAATGYTRDVDSARGYTILVKYTILLVVVIQVTLVRLPVPVMLII